MHTTPAKIRERIAPYLHHEAEYPEIEQIIAEELFGEQNEEPPRDGFKFVAFNPTEIAVIREISHALGGRADAVASEALLGRVADFLEEFSTSSGIPMGAPLPPIPEEEGDEMSDDEAEPDHAEDEMNH